MSKGSPGLFLNRLWLPLASLGFIALLAVAPWVVANRAFGGKGVLVTPWSVIDLTGRASTLPELGWLGPFFVFWVVLATAAALLSFVGTPRQRARGLYLLGGVGLAAFLVEAYLFYQAVWAVNNTALAEGVSPRRLPLKRYTLSLGAYAGFFYSLALILAGRLQLPGGRAFLVRWRGVVVPLVSMFLAVLAGAGVVWLLKDVPAPEGAGRLAYLTIKLDTVTYTFQLLFGPVLSLSGIFQSLLLATPLIFTGLAVAFGFKAGLFNIGAPGQLTMGAIAAMLVGVYLPGPRVIVLPLAIAAAAAGGALWGAIPGWLKARFGAHEVINTIMMNFVAASIFLFLISANEYTFFGYTVHLPFKYPGYEARSYEIQEEARIPMMLHLLGFDGAGPGHLSLALPLAGVLGLLAYLLLRRLELGHRLLAALGAGVLGYLVGGYLPGIPMEVSPSLASVRLNGAFLIALFAVGFYNYFMWRTKGGYELRAVGLAPKAAEYGGVNIARKTVLAMAISGALAGLAATHYVLGGGIDEYRLKQSLPTNVGFDGIAVALLGQNTPLGVFLSALLFGVLLTGGLQLNLQLGISRELVTILQALIVLFIAAGGFLPRYFVDPLLAAKEEQAGKEVV
ncbi:ABC transporter permease [Marinithermus hydrothermalis]|uniref:ABC-type transporter, integral membrane subunit n=1 Tax=Marinithermus hydrothermalis (strain DSM 14884 / JCM 11576 / T1) TaxID=869210 RepID=F2NNC6_MARHT|nr:ABC transporter permease [Marinithermus hydrothermalis]AEB10967.1 ABC-type transporter, integral membrane subunit [Marinithermus hydrothermalis DSM 14884]